MVGVDGQPVETKRSWRVELDVGTLSVTVEAGDGDEAIATAGSMLRVLFAAALDGGTYYVREV